MNRWRDSTVTVLSLVISTALVITGYLLGLLAAKTFVAAGILVATVALLAVCFSAAVAHHFTRAFATKIDEDSTQNTADIKASFQSSIDTLGADFNRSLRSVEIAVYDYLATFNPARSGAPFGSSEIAILTKQQAAAIEASAEEVWIYAVNMNWDVDESVLGKVVEDNLREAARYRFLIPDRPEVLNRVRVLYTRWRSIPDIDNRVSFRIRHEELLFAKFAISIYNPNYEKASEERRSRQTCVILFPNFGRPSPGSEDPFLKLNGPIVSDYEVEFSQIWQEAQKYLPAALENL